MNERGRRRRLSTIDAFFVAYQDRSGILMSLGCEVSFRGRIPRRALEAGLAHLLCVWPRLGQRLRRCAFGLAWSGEPKMAGMLREGSDRRELDRWRNQPIDPFREPPFQLLAIPDEERHILSFRAHHAVADGESLFLACREMARFIAAGTSPPAEPAPHPPSGFRSFVRPLRARTLFRLWSYSRWTAAEARSARTGRLPLRSLAPGDVALLVASLAAEEVEELRRLASVRAISASALFAAAWMRVLHREIVRRGGSPGGSISLEIPISLRRRPGQERWLGNYVAPLVVVGDARRETEELARDVHRQLAQGYRRRLHLATPLFTSFARFLPWSLFRRLAVTTSSTGYATGHFTHLRAPVAPDAELREISRGVLEIEGLRLWTPVCRTMGAALAVLELPATVELFITYRPNALAAEEARSLSELLLQELRSAVRMERRRLA